MEMNGDSLYIQILKPIHKVVVGVVGEDPDGTPHLQYIQA